MDKAQLHILQHSLGLNEYGQGRQYRNHYVAGGKDIDHCRELVGMGYMREHKMAPELTGGGPCFVVTDRGVEAVALFSPAPPPPPKLTQAQKQYRDYHRSEYGDSFADYLGINVPRVDVEYDYRSRGIRIWRWRYVRITHYEWGVDEIAGEWKPTKKEAKASYKAALQRRRQPDTQATQAVA